MQRVLFEELRCGDDGQPVPLEQAIHESGSVVVSADPFVGDLEIPLALPNVKVQAVATCLKDASDAFGTPRYVSRLSRVPSETFFLVVAHDTTYTALMCLSHSDQVSLLSGASTGLCLKLTSGSTRAANSARPVLVAVQRSDPYSAVVDAVTEALSITGGNGKVLAHKAPQPLFFDHLGWCSGPSLGVDVSHDAILDAAWSLKQRGIQLGFVVVDEGWQHVTKTRRDPRNPPAMLSFDADPLRFPRGLKGLCHDLKQAGLERVGVWHGMMGYRGGVHADLARRYGLPPDRRGCYFPGYDLGKTFEFYHDYYSFLREQGVSFIKVGDQGSAHQYCRSGMDVTRLYRHLHTAIQAAASIQFQSAPLNTECGRGENLLYWNSSRTARTASDIDLKTPVGAMRSIRNNVSNAAWMQHLMQPDVDTWTTTGVHSETLAIFHALSGSFSTIADRADDHDVNLLHKLTLPDGRVPSPDRILTPCRESLFTDPLENKTLFKTFSLRGDVGVMGVFNLVNGKGPVNGTICAAQIEGLRGNVFAVYSHRRGFLGIKERGELIRLRIRSKEADVYTFSPVVRGVAAIGCYRMLLPPGPITKIEIGDDLVVIDTCATVPLLVYSESQVFEVRRNGEACPWEYDKNRHTLTIAARSKIGSAPATFTVSFEE